MAKILVKTPITSNGRDPIMGADGKMIYKETILEAAAKPTLEKINAKLPTHLKRIISDYSEVATPAPVAEKKPVNYGPWGLKKLQAELEDRNIPYDEDADKLELATILKNDDESNS